MLKKIIFAFVVVITVGIFGRTFWAYEKVKEGENKEISTSVIQSVSTSTGQQEINASMIAPTSTQKLHTINAQQNSLKPKSVQGIISRMARSIFRVTLEVLLAKSLEQIPQHLHKPQEAWGTREITLKTKHRYIILEIK